MPPKPLPFHVFGGALAALLSISACGGNPAPVTDDVAFREGETCPGVADQSAQAADFLDALFPRSAADAPQFCKLDPAAEQCQAQGFHLGGVVPFQGSPPTVTECQDASGNLLLRCDKYAKHTITAALEDGSLIDLLRGVTRIPSYYRLASPARRLQQLADELTAGRRETVV